MTSTRVATLLVVTVFGCAKVANDRDSSVDVDANPSPDSGSGSNSHTLAEQYPGDVGIETDPSVVFAEAFDEATIVQAQDHFNSDSYILNGGLMSLVGDVPAASSGHTSLAMPTVQAAPSTALFKLFANDYDELFLRYYIKYPAGGAWHHTGIWIGGYADRTPYAFPHAGELPNGDDRLSVGVEPVETAGGSTGPDPRMDFYAYWMKMRPGGDGNYWGNSLIGKTDFHIDDGQWMCLEVHIKLNPDPATSVGAELDVWKNDQLVQDLTPSDPIGNWIHGVFCPVGSANSYTCTHYSATEPGPVGADLQWRKSASLRLNYIWPQNDTRVGDSVLYFDDVVVATKRIGCVVKQ